MNGFVWTIGILIAAALIAVGCWLYLFLIDVALEEPRKFCFYGSGAAGYPPLDTPAYYWRCTTEILRVWLRAFFPFGVAMLASALIICELLGSRVTCLSIRPGFGLALIIVCIVTSLDWDYWVRYGSDLFIRWRCPMDATDIHHGPPWPALPMLIWPRSWRYALIILSCWISCALCLCGIFASSFEVFIPGLALVILNTYPIYLHGQTALRSGDRLTTAGQ